jgi:hypothetical protein
MAGANKTRQKIVVPDAPALAISKRFGGYVPEVERAVGRIAVVEDETLKQLKEAWKACGWTCDPTRDYAGMLEIVGKLEYSAKDIENFSLALVDSQDKKPFSSGKAGVFLSALVDGCKDSEFVIHTGHLAEPIHFLGSRALKNITVEGDVGYAVGDKMEGGEIHIDGDYKGISTHIERGRIFQKGKLIFEM